MFLFEKTPVGIYYLQASIDEATDLDQFLDRTLNIQGIYLASSLKAVREYLMGQFADKIADLTERLKRDAAEKLNSEEAANLVARLLPAVAEWQGAIARVASWFALDEATAQRSQRTMHQILNIALEATRAARRGFDPILHLQVEDIGWQSPDAMVEMTHIIFTILDNVWLHSGMGDRPHVWIDISGELISQQQFHIHVRVENEVPEGAPSQAQERKLAKIRAMIESGEYRSRVKLEGGTGFLKLKRIIVADPRQSVKFGYSGKGFVVELGLVFRALSEAGDNAGA